MPFLRGGGEGCHGQLCQVGGGGAGGVVKSIFSGSKRRHQRYVPLQLLISRKVVIQSEWA